MYYTDFFLLDRIKEAINPPENVSNYICKNRKVKIYRPRYDAGTGQYLGLYETSSSWRLARTFPELRIFRRKF